MSKVEFNQEYFDNIMKEASEEEASKHGDAVNTVCTLMSKNILVSLFKLEGAEFYSTLLKKLGSLRYQEQANKNAQKAIEEVMSATGLSEKQVREELEQEKIERLNGISTFKLVVGNILGFLKFSLDVLLLSTAYVGRVSSKLAVNLGKAVIDTGKFAIEDGKEVGKAINKSWNFNMKNIS